MTIDGSNDEVRVFRDVLGGWRWRRVDKDNGRIVSVSGDSYGDQSYAEEAAAAYNVGVAVRVLDG